MGDSTVQHSQDNLQPPSPGEPNIRGFYQRKELSQAVAVTQEGTDWGDVIQQPQFSFGIPNQRKFTAGGGSLSAMTHCLHWLHNALPSTW